MATESQENVGVFTRFGEWAKGCFAKIVNSVTGTAKQAKKLAQEDPRRIVHSLKVGLAITGISLFYYFDSLYQGFGENAMWAVMTVVVLFEFSVGATLGKGINRAIATLLGGALGVAFHDSASFTGEKIEPVLLGLSVFLIAAMATFTRFFPKMKARYDYGVLIFILSFSLISVSGYRDDVVLDTAHRRLSTVLIGGAATLLVCVLIRPVWAGEDLHKLTAANIEKLGIFLEGFGGKYFPVSNGNNQENQVSLDEYKTILNSKSIEDTLVNFAKWEPRHGKFRYRHPWSQYLKIGSLTRECAYKIDALNTYLNSDVQVPLEIRTVIQEPCMKISSQCSYALKELATGMNTMTCSFSADPHLLNAKTAAKQLKALLKTGPWPDTDLLEIAPVVTVASLLIEVVFCSIKVAESVHVLASVAKFKIPDLKMVKQTSVQMSRTPSKQSGLEMTRAPSKQSSLEMSRAPSKQTSLETSRAPSKQTSLQLSRAPSKQTSRHMSRINSIEGSHSINIVVE